VIPLEQGSPAVTLQPAAQSPTGLSAVSKTKNKKKGFSPEQIVAVTLQPTASHQTNRVVRGKKLKNGFS
jgi:hypothetical protein